MKNIKYKLDKILMKLFLGFVIAVSISIIIYGINGLPKPILDLTNIFLGMSIYSFLLNLSYLRHLKKNC